MSKSWWPAKPTASGCSGTASPGATWRRTTVLVRSWTIVIGAPPKCANARRWQSKKVCRSWLVVKQQNGSREYD